MNKCALLLLAACVLFFENHACGQWVHLDGPFSHAGVGAIAVSGGNILAVANSHLFLSTDNGTSWTAIDSCLPANTGVWCLAASGSNIFAGTAGGIFLSTDNGTSWTAVNSGFKKDTVTCFAVSGSNIFAGTYGGRVFLSTNNGANWTAVNSRLTNTWVNCLAVSGGSIFAGTGANMDGYCGGVFLSTNNGTSWKAVNSGLPASPACIGVVSLAVSGGSIFAGTSGGVFLSTNNGTNWKEVDSGLPENLLEYITVNCFAVSGSNIFAGTYGGGVFLSTNNGTSWTAVNSAVSSLWANPIVYSLAMSGSDIFAGTDNWGIWRRPLSDMVSIIPQNQQTIPLKTRLRVAASGALHSGVMLNYSIRSRCIVHLGIYAVSGKQVALLEQGERAPGEYAFKFDTGRIPAGFYVCRFQAGSYQESNRLMVVK
jgi:photosystem II stability/assembly factor-like uncharacterized protein